MRIGAHQRTGKGLDEAIERAAGIGCEAIQVFAANPSAWRTRAIPAEIAAAFRDLAIRYDIHPVVIHTQYLLNLASSDETIYSRSVEALADSLVRADALGAEYVVTHIGSHRGLGAESGIARVQAAVRRVLEESPSPAVLLLENSAGGGDLVGGQFEDLRDILGGLREFGDRLGVCLDTAHLWGAGYDVSGPEAADRTLAEFDSVVGLEWLMLVHMNDSRSALGSRSDRHANIGQGEIGLEGLAALMRHPALREPAVIIETPASSAEDHARDIAVLKELRGDGMP